MSTYRLDRLLSPRSLAVVGASPHENSVGRHIIANIISAGFSGPVHVVNPHYGEIEGLATIKSLASIGDAPDVVIIAAPPAALPELVAEAARRRGAASDNSTLGIRHVTSLLPQAHPQAVRTTVLTP